MEREGAEEGGSRRGREQEREGEGVGGGTQRMGEKDKKNHRRRDRVERRKVGMDIEGEREWIQS